MSKRIFQNIRFISYTPTVHDKTNKTTSYPKKYIGLQADSFFIYFDETKIHCCRIDEKNNPIIEIFENIPENIHPKIRAKYDDYIKRRSQASFLQNENQYTDKLTAKEKDLIKIYRKLSTKNKIHVETYAQIRLDEQDPTEQKNPRGVYTTGRI